MTSTLTDDYVLGTHDAELTRLGLQHRIWRARALDGWQRAGFAPGQTLLDVGAGPGYASVDLAEIAGPSGRVLAFDRSARYLDALRSSAVRNGLTNIVAKQIDLDTEALPASGADGAWVRWVFAFMSNPRGLVERIGAALRSGGALVIHEYFDYRTWSFAERSRTFDGFVEAVIRSWKNTGGDPDVGRPLPAWLEQSGFRIASLRPYIDVIAPGDFIWPWPKAFVSVGAQRLVDIGELSEKEAAAIVADFETREAQPHVRMVTPAVLEIIAIKE